MRERNDIFGPPGVAKFPRKLRKEFLAALRQFALIELHSDPSIETACAGLL